MLQKAISNPIFQALLILICFFFLYASTAPPTNVSYADSDLMTTIGYFAGVAHPPGYPIYMLLVFIATHLPIPGTIAFRAHLLSAALHAATLAILYLTSFNLAHHFKAASKSFLSPKLVTPLTALSATATLGFSYLFWLYSSVAEKYPLNDLFAATIFYFTVQLSLRPEAKHARLWLALSVVFSLALAHHHSILMLGPMLLLLAWHQRPTFLASLKFTLPLFTLTYLATVGLLLWLNHNPAPVSWHFAPTASGLARHLTRREFTGYNLIQGQYRGIYLDPVSLREILTKIPIYTDLLVKHFGAVAMGLLAFGLYAATRLRHRLARLFLLTFLATTVFIPLYLDWGSDLSVQSLRVRLYLIGYLVIPVFITLALTKIFHALENHQTKKNTFKLAFFGLLILAPFLRAPVMYSEVNLNTTTYIHDHYQRILTSLPDKSLLTCISDVSCFALLYAHYVEGIRPDVTLIPHGWQLVEHSRPQTATLLSFDYPQNPQRFLDYLTSNLGKRPVFIVELQQLYSDLLGLNYGFLYYVPHGYYGQLLADQPKVLPGVDESLSDLLVTDPLPALDHSRLQFRAQLLQKHLLNSISYSRFGQTSLVSQELARAHALSVGLPESYLHEVGSVTQLLTTPQTFDQYVPGVSRPTKAQILSQAQTYAHQGSPQLAFIGINSVLYQNPLDLAARLQLANLYLQEGDQDMTLLEIDNILKFDPHYQPALNLRSQTATSN